MRDVLYGVLITSSIMVGIFFLRFWRQTRDRFFLLFATAFWCLALNWIGLLFDPADETETYFYLLRLGAFVLILIAIVDRNRKS
jgi:type II secretory pathway component PulM